MPVAYNIQRFIDAQKDSYDNALAEIKSGRKRSHWMWYIFPQIKGLGSSDTAMYYGINDIEEAQQYLKNKILGSRLVEICKALLGTNSSDAHQVFGSPDDMKLKSSMTLFSQVKDASPVFKQVLQKFFKGENDAATCRLLNNK